MFVWHHHLRTIDKTGTLTAAMLRQLGRSGQDVG